MMEWVEQSSLNRALALLAAFKQSTKSNQNKKTFIINRLEFIIKRVASFLFPSSKERLRSQGLKARRLPVVSVVIFVFL